MAEFKKLSEVDLLETSSDNTTVLVEDGGEIKRVPKKEVGGAGGYVVTLTQDSIMETSLSGNYPVAMCSINYDEMYDILMAGGSCYVDISALTFDKKSAPNAVGSAAIPQPTNFAGHKLMVMEWFRTDIGLQVFGMCNLMGVTFNIIFPNGSHNLESLGSDK